MAAAAQPPFWPPGVPRRLVPVSHTLDDNLRRAAARTPGKPALVFYGALTPYAELDAEVSRVAGWLQAGAGVRPGDRVGLFMQNAPQFVAGFYGIVRAGGVVVPLNAMYRTAELRHIVADAGIRVVLAAQDLLAPLQPLLDDGALVHVLVARYADALPQPCPDGLPAWLTMPPTTADKPLILGVANDGLWRRFCALAGLEAFVDRPEFRTNADRVRHREATVALVRAKLSERPRDAWMAALSDAGIPCSPLHTLGELATHPHSLKSEMIRTFHDPVIGDWQTVSQPLRFDGERPTPRLPPPRLGEDGPAILRRAGFPDAEIEALLAAGTVKG